MATIASLSVLVTANTRAFHAGMDKVSGKLRGVQAQMTKTRSLTTAMAGAAGFGFAAQKLFELGASVEETGSKFNAVFGDSAESVQTFNDSFATMAGLSKTAAQEVTATTGAIVQGMGFAQRESAAFSTEVVKLAGDLSSFNNIPIGETSRAIQSALTGEREAMKRLGIVIRETDVQQRALANTGKSNVKALTDQERATATLQIITERAGAAVGDLARTQNSAANQARQLKAEVLNIAETMAVSLLPAFNFVIGGVNKFIKGFQIMGAETAVFGAKIQLLLAELQFWDREGIVRARRNLEFMKTAAAEVTGEVVGMVPAVQGAATAFGTDTGGGGGRGLVPAVGALNTGLLNLTTTIPLATVKLYDSANASALVGSTASNAADEVNRLNSALGRIGGLSSILGILGLGGPAGLIGKGLGLFGGGRSLFAGLFAKGGTIPAGQFGVVGEAGPELVSGPATVTPTGGGDTVVNVQIVAQNGQALTDGITIRQKRNDALGRVVRVPVPALGVAG